MVAVRFDRRLSPRVDPSDIVQEALAEAAGKLDGYLRSRPISFYPWLRQIAEQRIIAARRRHLDAGRRTLARQEPNGLPNESVQELAERLLAGEAPSAGLRRSERKAVVRAALERLKESDREVLVLRFLEELPSREVAEILGVTEGAVRLRMMRALERLRDNLKRTGDWS
jgi:RNA polymerase sigma-70 factor (ECF subfamily)